MTEEFEFRRFMVIVAHPDDGEFSCAGTIAKWIREGKQGYYVICTSGNKGSADPSMTSEELARIREAEQREASAILGMTETIFLRLPDNELHINVQPLREAITRLLRQYQPDVVITHDAWRPYALHSDHRTVGLTTVDSVYPTARDRLNFPEHEAAGLKPWKVGKIYLYGAEEPDTWVDVSETIGTKFEALCKHVCQVGEADGLEDRIRERAREVGQAANLDYAEAFKVITLRR